MRRSLILAAVVLLGGLAACRCRPRPGPCEGTRAPSPPRPAAPAAKSDLPRQTVDLGGGVTFGMVRIPAGEFDMGSPETEEGRHEDETLHRVRLTKPFWMATTELTQAVWEAVMESNPSTTKGPTLPVTYVSWDDCQAFVKRLNEKVAGDGFRLPTEAEWEYACRAGSTTRFCFGDAEKALAEYAWTQANSGGAVHPVSSLKPNPWGLFDMHGNVWEWCEDAYAPYVGASVTDPTGASGSDTRVGRGGGWFRPAELARSAERGPIVPGFRFGSLGFRVARTVTADAPPPQAPGSAPPPAPAPKPGEPPPPAAPPAKEGEVPSWAKVAPEQIEAARKAGVPVAFENSIGMRFVLIPAGTFTMGSPETEEGRDDAETQHEVTLTKPYYLGVTEVTNGQYRRFKADHHSVYPWRSRGYTLDGDEQPVVNVSVDDVAAFAKWLNAKDPGRTYRLPTEAEWERACRAGTTTPFWWGRTITTEQANYYGSWTLDGVHGPPGVDRHETVPVGSLPPSPWGLYEMHGNVAEWCADSFGRYAAGRVTDPIDVSPPPDDYHVLRGGTFADPPSHLRAAARGAVPWERDYGYGVRLAVSVPAK